MVNHFSPFHSLKRQKHKKRKKKKEKPTTSSLLSSLFVSFASLLPLHLYSFIRFIHSLTFTHILTLIHSKETKKKSDVAF